MLFSSVTFLFFFLPVTLIGVFLLPQKLKLPFLLLLSLLFYAWGEPVYVLLMVFSVCVSYFAGRLMERHEKHKKLILFSALIIHLALLGVLKYANFVCDLVNVSIPAIALPIGISFYTFQSISYCVDVYRGDVQAEKRIVPFGVYISYFPQLIAGPIERYPDIRPQLDTIGGFSVDNMARGAQTFVVGLSKKLLLANAMGQLWEHLSVDPSSAGFIGCWAAALAYTFQIYFDFSGYSDMARGLAQMMGVRLTENFRYPYAADSITDFWRRWHITLSTWFREYVYIPLGGNRRGKARQALNLLIVWTLTGLWHGAGVNFILWGMYYAVLLIAEKFLLKNVLQKLPRALRHVVTLVLVMLGWVLFGCESMQGLSQMLQGMFVPQALWSADARAWVLSFIPMLAVCCIACVPVTGKLKKHFTPVMQLCALLILLLLCVASLYSQGYNPFLYFRF